MSVSETTDTDRLPLGARLAAGFRRLFAPAAALQETGARRQAQLLMGLALVLSVTALLGALSALRDVTAAQPRIAFGVVAGLWFGAFWIGRTRHYSIGSWVVILTLCASGFYLVLTGAFSVQAGLLSFLPLAYVLGSILLGPLSLAAVVVLSTLAAVLLPAVNPALAGPDVLAAAGAVAALGLLLIVTNAVQRSVENARRADLTRANQELRGLQASLEQRVAERTRDLGQAQERTQTLVGQLREASRIARVANFEFDLAAQAAVLSDAFYDLVGTNAAAHGGHRLPIATAIERFVHPDDAQRMSDGLRHLLEPGEARQAEFEYRFVRADGETLHMSMRLEIERNLSGRAVHAAGAVQDVTQHKLAEIALREREEDLAALLEHSPEAIGVVNTQTGLFENVNSAAERLYGLRRAELVKVGLAQVSAPVQPDGRASAEAVAEKLKAAQAGERVVFEWVHRNSIGQLIPCEVRLVGLTEHRSHLVRFSATDISERRQASEALAQRTLALETLNHIGQTLAGTGDVGSKLRAVGERVCQTFKVDTGFIGLYDGAANQISFAFMRDGGESLELPPRPLTTGLTATVIKSRQLLLLHDADSARRLGVQVVGSSGVTESWLGVPLLSGEDVIGIISVQHAQANRFSEADARLLTTISANIGTAIQSARLFDQARKRAADLAVVAEVGTVASTMKDAAQLLQAAVDLARDRFDVYHAHVYLVDDAGETLRLAAGSGEVGRRMTADGRTIALNHPHSLVARAARSRAGVIVNDVAQAPDFLAHPLLPETKSELAVPLIAGDEVLGVLDVQASETDRFTDEDIRIQSALASQIAVALQNVRTYQRSEKTLRELDAITRRLTGEGWNSYIDALSGEHLGFLYDSASLAPLAEPAPVGDAQVVQPITVHGEVIGRLVVAEAGPLDDDARNLIATVVDRLSAHLDNLRLTEQTQAALAETSRLYTTSALLTASGSLHEAAISAAQPAIEAGAGSVTLLTVELNLAGEPDYATVAAAWQRGGEPGMPLGARFSLVDFPLSSIWLADRDNPVLIDDARSDARLDEAARDLLGASGTVGLVLMPLTVGQQWVGLLLASWPQPPHFTASDARLYKALAAQAAVVVNNRLLFEQTRRRADRERLVNAITQKIQGATTVQGALQTAIQELGQAFKARLTRVELNAAEPANGAHPSGAAG